MTHGTIWIGTSFKMNKTVREARDFVEGLSAEGPPGIQRFVLPPHTALAATAEAARGKDVLIGAQNMHFEDAGAFTGEISPAMVTDCGGSIVELGHSERRAMFGETDDTVGRKVAAALRHGLIALVCVGESAAERDAGTAGAVLARQVRAALSDAATGGTVLFAYEPVWAIGAGGTPATPEYADAQQQRIRALASELRGEPVPCLYGGSVNLANAAALITCAHIDGLFIGRAAWDVSGYNAILEAAAAALTEKPT